MTDRDDPKYVLGDAYSMALTAVFEHVTDCSTCVWIGDYCAERETLMDALFGARLRCEDVRRWREGVGPPAGKHTTMYFVHELNDQGDVIETHAFTAGKDDKLQMLSCENILRSKGKPFRVERATLNENGVVVNKEDVT